MFPNALPVLMNFQKHAFSTESACAFLYNSCNSPLHKHCDFYEFSFVTYGKFRNTYNDVVQDCPKNTLLFFKKGETHEIHAIQEDSIHFTFIVKEKYFEKAFAQFFPTTPLETLGAYRYIVLSDRQSDYLAELAQKLKDHSCRGYSDAYVQLFLFTVLSFCIINETQKTTSSPQSATRYVEDLLIKLNNFAYIKHSVNQIYMEYPIAQSSLITSFKKHTGKTIVQYHNEKKMEYAAQLLSIYDYSVTDVCFLLNYSSLSHFGKLFKAHYGMTPQKYHKLYFERYSINPEQLEHL